MERKMATYTGINHLAMATKNMDKTIRFWRDLLGMRLVAGLGASKYKHYFFEISEYDMIAFFEWPEVENIPEKDHGAPVKGPFAFDHVSLSVESDDDLWELKDKMEAAGIWVSEVINHGFIHSIYTFDPNNIPIEFSAPVSGVDLRKDPKMKDRTPTAAALEGPEPQTGHWPDAATPTPFPDRAVYPGEGMVLAEHNKEKAIQGNES
jgi:catechol 2,3-dioxygenase-like lactoylglutathione lyase family enzyme